MSREHFDAVVVGSGFGGSVTAYRLAEAGLRVCLLERGKAYPPGSFPRTPAQMQANFWDPSEGLYGLYNVWSFKRMNALLSSGLGGGSLIYANVLLRKDEKWFVREPVPEQGYEEWPVTRQMLDPHYDRVERMMNVQPYPVDHPPYDRTQKTRAMRTAGERLGLEWMLPPLAVTFANPGEPPVLGEPIREEHRNLHDRTRMTCRLCGECDAGCNYGSKNTLDYNYLSEAKRHGAEIRTLCEVTEFAPLTGGGYRVRYREHREDRPRGEHTPETEISAGTLVLAAGTLGTTYLLLKNRSSFPGLSNTLGHRFSGNGDLLAFATRCHREENGERRPWPMESSSAPVITSALRMPDAADGGTGRGFYIEDAGYPAFLQWIIELSQVSGAARRALFFGWGRVKSALGLARDPDVGAELSQLLGPCVFSSTSVPLLGMGRDVPDGHLRLKGGRLDTDWKIDTSRKYFERLRSTMKDVAGVLDAEFLDNPIWYLDYSVITVHPLGGAPMGHTPEQGVVDPHGQVFGYPGLYVTDGAAMPGPVGANPSLTIAAFADRAADHMVERARGARAS